MFIFSSISVNNDQSNNITIDALNACVEIKVEFNCKNTSIQNYILVNDDGYSVKVDKPLSHNEQ